MYKENRFVYQEAQKKPSLEKGRKKPAALPRAEKELDTGKRRAAEKARAQKENTARKTDQAELKRLEANIKPCTAEQLEKLFGKVEYNTPKDRENFEKAELTVTDQSIEGINIGEAPITKLQIETFDQAINKLAIYIHYQDGSTKRILTRGNEVKRVNRDLKKLPSAELKTKMSRVQKELQGKYGDKIQICPEKGSEALVINIKNNPSVRFTFMEAANGGFKALRWKIAGNGHPRGAAENLVQMGANEHLASEIRFDDAYLGLMKGVQESFNQAIETVQRSLLKLKTALDSDKGTEVKLEGNSLMVTKGERKIKVDYVTNSAAGIKEGYYISFFDAKTKRFVCLKGATGVKEIPAAAKLVNEGCEKAEKVCEKPEKAPEKPVKPRRKKRHTPKRRVAKKRAPTIRTETKPGRRPDKPVKKPATAKRKPTRKEATAKRAEARKERLRIKQESRALTRLKKAIQKSKVLEHEEKTTAPLVKAANSDGDFMKLTAKIAGTKFQFLFNAENKEYSIHHPKRTIAGSFKKPADVIKEIEKQIKLDAIARAEKDMKALKGSLKVTPGISTKITDLDDDYKGLKALQAGKEVLSLDQITNGYFTLWKYTGKNPKINNGFERIVHAENFKTAKQAFLREYNKLKPSKEESEKTKRLEESKKNIEALKQKLKSFANGLGYNLKPELDKKGQSYLLAFIAKKGKNLPDLWIGESGLENYVIYKSVNNKWERTRSSEGKLEENIKKAAGIKVTTTLAQEVTEKTKIGPEEAKEFLYKTEQALAKKYKNKRIVENIFFNQARMMLSVTLRKPDGKQEHFFLEYKEDIKEFEMLGNGHTYYPSPAKAREAFERKIDAKLVAYAKTPKPDPKAPKRVGAPKRLRTRTSLGDSAEYASRQIILLEEKLKRLTRKRKRQYSIASFLAEGEDKLKDTLTIESKQFYNFRLSYNKNTGDYTIKRYKYTGNKTYKLDETIKAKNFKEAELKLLEIWEDAAKKRPVVKLSKEVQTTKHTPEKVSSELETEYIKIHQFLRARPNNFDIKLLRNNGLAIGIRVTKREKIPGPMGSSKTKFTVFTIKPQKSGKGYELTKSTHGHGSNAGSRKEKLISKRKSINLLTKRFIRIIIRDNPTAKEIAAENAKIGELAKYLKRNLPDRPLLTYSFTNVKAKPQKDANLLIRLRDARNGSGSVKYSLFKIVKSPEIDFYNVYVKVKGKENYLGPCTGKEDVLAAISKHIKDQ